MASPHLLHVSAVCVYNEDGELLTVRKRGTEKFMHPGGKPEPGESAAEAARRELFEEVGINIEPERLTELGVWDAVAANEEDTVIRATVFTADGVWDATPAAEIADVRWMSLDAPWPSDLAPLLTEHVLPALLAQR
ncbi:NUDIX domain-containing protein [Arthrobacter sp. NPDC090010]|uniref:NUDIX hydrolase n=1 Tax=Arthrobacter sp. NPDC090010 TaxID=3363942 RepID=UPI00380F69B5